MQYINGLCTQRYNRLKRTDGPLFRGRYKAILIERDACLAQLTRYIHRNPIDMKQPLIKRLENHLWSSYPAYVNKVPSPTWLYREETYALLGNGHRYSGYRRFIELGVEDEIKKFYKQPGQAPLLGSNDFKNRVYAAEDNRELVQQIKKPETALPGIGDMVKAVTFLTGEEESAVYRANVVEKDRWRVGWRSI